MRLFEVLCTCVLIFSYFPYVSQSLSPALKTYSRKMNEEYELNRDKFLFNGFIDLCDSTSEEDWNVKVLEWERLCCALWKIEDFKIVKKDGVIKESWTCSGKQMTALYRKK